MNRIIIICLFSVLLLPLTIMGFREGITLKEYLVRCFVPLTIIGVFLLNYYWLIPYTMRNDSRKTFVLANTFVMILCLTSFYLWNYFLGGKHHHRGPAMFFEALNVMFAVFAAHSLRSNQQIDALKQKHHEAELARQKAELAKQEAELKSLKNNISPHFLLNTLNNIYVLAGISPQKTQDALMQLSRLLRHSLYEGAQNSVLLTGEAEFITSYINLMKLRLASNTTVETHINIANDRETEVAPLIFISLVENAFKHGVVTSSPCFVSIRITEDNETIKCFTSNSNHPKKQADRSGHGIGLQLVQRRLDSLYAGRYIWNKYVDQDNVYHSEITILKPAFSLNRRQEQKS